METSSSSSSSSSSSPSNFYSPFPPQLPWSPADQQDAWVWALQDDADNGSFPFSSVSSDSSPPATANTPVFPVFNFVAGNGLSTEMVLGGVEWPWADAPEISERQLHEWQQQQQLQQLPDPPLFPPHDLSAWMAHAPSAASSAATGSGIYDTNSASSLSASPLGAFSQSSFPPSPSGVPPFLDESELWNLNGLPPVQPPPSVSVPVSADRATGLAGPAFPWFVPADLTPGTLDAFASLPMDGFALQAFPPLSPGPPVVAMTNATADVAAVASMHAAAGNEVVNVTVSPPPAAPSPPAPASARAPQPASDLVCPECHRACPTMQRLRKHMRTHTRPFSCAVCGRGHGAKRDLHRHLWTTHPEEAARAGIPSFVRPCPVAGCRFAGRHDNLMRHIRTRHPGHV
ncbi:Zinc finger, C2H2-type/integrase, DNA-binding protein [Niveomyces insectorum RCEF 264]|uniref:Zinc finger, C2H2-type/integrase, DNA-binding protein n=1 Tax=Niveomyces insectorum RCEF 264 TaxID=1081102 RepID=A0A167Y9C4_9HYPO|nr:Zinc finger, C2H2-type/integrase, DNA-binding protein [Niveomyces insectorum RCEF 264]